MARFHCRFLFLAQLLLLAGCQPEAKKSPNTVPLPASPSRETWSMVMIDGTKIGHSSQQVSELVRDQQTLRKWQSVNELTLLRSGTTTHQQTKLTSVETRQGKLLHCQTQMQDGTNRTQVHARVQGNRLVVTMTLAGKQQEFTLDWDPQWRGFFGVEQSLRSKPMQPGEKRQVVMLAPILMKPTTVRLEATSHEPTALLTGSRPLLRIHRSDEVPVANGQTITVQSTLWMDPGGEILKTLTPGMGLEEYRTDQQHALAKTGSRPVDINSSFSVQLKQAIPQPHATQHMRYQVTIEKGEVSDFFSQGPAQQITALENGEAYIDVRSIAPGHKLPASLHPEPQPTAEDTAPNSLIQSDHSGIVALANSLAPGVTDPWEIACSLERHVCELITRKDFSQVFASAADVMQSRQGDCTEHAVLLAALCRARQIPTRVAIGLVHVPRPGNPEMAYHMWNEVWIKDHWYPLDATLGKGGIGAGHLKLTDSSLAGASAFSVLLPVTQVVRRLRVKIVSSQ